jgi:hypothetical protein
MFDDFIRRPGISRYFILSIPPKILVQYQAGNSPYETFDGNYTHYHSRLAPSHKMVTIQILSGQKQKVFSRLRVVYAKLNGICSEGEN